MNSSSSSDTDKDEQHDLLHDSSSDTDDDEQLDLFHDSSSDTDDDEQRQLFYDVDGILIFKDEVRTLIHSNDNDHKNKLNLLVTKIISKGDHNKLEYLIKKGYKISVMDKKGQTAIHLAFYETYNDDLINDNGLLLFSCADDQNYVDSLGLSLFHIACCFGNLSRVMCYLDSGVDVNKPCNENFESHLSWDVGNLTALHFAILSHQTEVVKLLLQKGADVYVYATESCGRRALQLATITDNYLWPSSYKQDLEIMEILVKYPNKVDTEDDHSSALLSVYDTYHYGSETFTVNIVSDDLKTTVKKTETFDPRVRKLEKVELLLKYGADITKTDYKGNTILHQVIDDLSIMHGPMHDPPISYDDAIHAEVIKKILTLGKNVDVNVKNNDGITPVQLAVTYMSSAIVKILLDCDADLSDLKFSEDGGSALFYPNIVPTLEYVQNSFAIINLLLEKGFNLTPQDNMELLKTFIHNDDFCCCDDVIKIDMGMKIDQIISLSMPTHTSYLKCSLGHINITDLDKYLNLIEHGKLFLDKKIRDAVKEVIDEYDFYPTLTSRSEEEIACMKNVKLKEISLYDVMTMNPHNIYQYIVNDDYQFLEQFYHYKDIIKGHLTKSLIRNYVEKSAYEYLEILLPSLLHYPCYQIIIKCLSNEDIWAVCCALFPENSYRYDERLIEYG